MLSYLLLNKHVALWFTFSAKDGLYDLITCLFHADISLLFGNLFMLYVPEHALSVWFENVIFALLFSYKEAPLTVHCAFSIGCF